MCQIFDDPSANYWALQLLLTDVINEHAPLKTTQVKAREVPFMNKRLKRAVREKTRMYNQYRKRPTPANWEQYRLQRNLTVTIRRDAIKAYFNDKCAGGAKNTDFWPTIKPFLTNKGAGGKSTIMVRVNDKNHYRSGPCQSTHERLLCEYCLENRWRHRREPNFRVQH